MARPKTAATSTKKDEERIKNKLSVLEKMECKIEEDIENFNQKKAKKEEKGLKITKKMILDSSQCDSLDQVQTIILRDKNLEVFDSNKEGQLDLQDLVNLECIYASHNKIKDLFGIS